MFNSKLISSGCFGHCPSLARLVHLTRVFIFGRGTSEFSQLESAFLTISPDDANGHSKDDYLTKARVDALSSAPGSPGCVCLVVSTFEVHCSYLL